jgi:hypothetical protein
MSGAIAFQTSLLISPGDQDVIDRLQLNGRFAVGEAYFSKVDVQQKVTN